MALSGGSDPAALLGLGALVCSGVVLMLRTTGAGLERQLDPGAVATIGASSAGPCPGPPPPSSTDIDGSVANVRIVVLPTGARGMTPASPENPAVGRPSRRREVVWC